MQWGTGQRPVPFRLKGYFDTLDEVLFVEPGLPG